MNLLAQYNEKHITQLTQSKTIPRFRAGDTLRVHTKIFDGNNTRIQIFEGLCISRKNNGLASRFTVRKISHDEGVEKTLPLYSPIVDKIDVIKRGRVRRAKLYYIRSLRGKAMRIKEIGVNG